MKLLFRELMRWIIPHLLDIKPYVKELDSKDDADYGWIDGLKGDKEHLLLYIKGVPHE